MCVCANKSGCVKYCYFNQNENKIQFNLIELRSEHIFSLCYKINWMWYQRKQVQYDTKRYSAICFDLKRYLPSFDIILPFIICSQLNTHTHQLLCTFQLTMRERKSELHARTQASRTENEKYWTSKYSVGDEIDIQFVVIVVLHTKCLSVQNCT